MGKMLQQYKLQITNLNKCFPSNLRYDLKSHNYETFIMGQIPIPDSIKV